MAREGAGSVRPVSTSRVPERCLREEHGDSRERPAGHCVHVRRSATAGKAIFTRERR